MTEGTIHIQVVMPPLLRVAGFTPDTTGCSPLTVKFINTSLYGESFIWDFGDGVFSSRRKSGSYLLHTGIYVGWK